MGMGRSNLVMKQANGTYLGLYLHNGGYRFKENVAQALQQVVQAGRQNDESYANRIAVSQMVGKHWEQGLNYGLNVGPTLNDAIFDNEQDVLLVDWIANKVTLIDDNMTANWDKPVIKAEYTINGFINGQWIYAPTSTND